MVHPKICLPIVVMLLLITAITNAQRNEIKLLPKYEVNQLESLDVEKLKATMKMVFYEAQNGLVDLKPKEW